MKAISKIPCPLDRQLHFGVIKSKITRQMLHFICTEGQKRRYCNVLCLFKLMFHILFMKLLEISNSAVNYRSYESPSRVNEPQSFVSGESLSFHVVSLYEPLSHVRDKFPEDEIHFPFPLSDPEV